MITPRDLANTLILSSTRVARLSVPGKNFEMEHWVCSVDWRDTRVETDRVSGLQVEANEIITWLLTCVS